MVTEFYNPFRPGAGQMPPYLAGRDAELTEFLRMLGQNQVLENLILTGLRGVGKTVLLETFKPEALKRGWLWAGSDLSESTSVSEEHFATRLLTDLAVATANVLVTREKRRPLGLNRDEEIIDHPIDYSVLLALYQRTPGLVADKLKAVLHAVWSHIDRDNIRGLILAYDEAQNMSDHPSKEQFPLALLLDVFQSIQRQGVRFLLVLTGLPTLFPKLVEARTFAERMFHVVTLKRLTDAASLEAIRKPLQDSRCPVSLAADYVKRIVRVSAGYPYFIQFICRAVYDVALQRLESKQKLVVPLDDIVRKLDGDFFAGRWARATDRQRDLLRVIAKLPNCDDEFTVQEIVDTSKTKLKKSFSASHVNQMLVALSNAGLVYKNRHGRYSFAVPLLGKFILRQETEAMTLGRNE